MALEKFELGTIDKIDNGRIREAFDQAMRRCEADCKDRPAVKDDRRVRLEVTMSPVIDPDGAMESCDVQFQIVDSVPKRKSKVYNMASTRAGLFFNELSPADAHQGTIDQAPKPERLHDVS